MHTHKSGIKKSKYTNQGSRDAHTQIRDQGIHTQIKDQGMHHYIHTNQGFREFKNLFIILLIKCKK
jgi:hypothetical protein